MAASPPVNENRTPPVHPSLGGAVRVVGVAV
jgi:hypothetical protein